MVKFRPSEPLEPIQFPAETMLSTRSWVTYPLTYRAKEIATLAAWLQAGASGAVVGPAGAGKSNLLGFLCHRPDALAAHLPPQVGPVNPLLIDLNSLPVADQGMLYRLVLRSFYEARTRFDSPLPEAIDRFYQQNRAERDPFLPFSDLRELLLLAQSQRRRIILVLDHFDNFGRAVPPALFDTLRGLRDSFKDTLFFLVGLRQPVVELPNPAALGELRRLLDHHTLWLGAMTQTDAHALIAQETASASTPPTEADLVHLLALTGGYPALLKATCQWWLAAGPPHPPPDAWQPALLATPGMQTRLAELWQGLSEAERLALIELAQGGLVAPQHRPALDQLAARGLCAGENLASAQIHWRIQSSLLAAFVAQLDGPGHGSIWLDEASSELYQGQTPLTDLSPLARSLLRFLVSQPRRRHPKTELIINAWPDDLRRDGVSDDSLYQVVVELRKKIEPDPGQPRYLLTWRGRPEGGYQFFPEGKPE